MTWKISNANQLRVVGGRTWPTHQRQWSSPSRWCSSSGEKVHIYIIQLGESGWNTFSISKCFFSPLAATQRCMICVLASYLMLVETEEEGRVPDAIFMSREISHHCCFSSIHYLAFWLMFVSRFFPVAQSFEPFGATQASSCQISEGSPDDTHETTWWTLLWAQSSTYGE